MPSIFPPGDTACSAGRSRWREQSYLFRELVSILIPPLGLRQATADWPIIRQSLADLPRRRQQHMLLS
jgi:hypothetical protein